MRGAIELSRELESDVKSLTNAILSLCRRVQALENSASRPGAAAPSHDADAARYRWLRRRVCGLRQSGFEFVNGLPPMPENWARGSIAEHFDRAIDTAIAKESLIPPSPQEK